jgi:drug/metabolite transporter (DMT)-like permease
MTLTPRLTLMLTLPPLLWAGNAVVGRLTVVDVPPLVLSLLRWSITLLVLLVLGRRVLACAQSRAEVLQRWRYLAVLGLLGVGAYNALQYLALTTSTPINVTLIAASGPLWTLIVGALAFGEPVRRRQLAGAALSLVGVAVVLGRGSLDSLLHVHLVPGDLLMLLAQASWAGYSWMLARPAPHMQGAERPQVLDAGQARPWNWAEFLLVQTIFGVAWTGLAAGVEQLAAPRAVLWSPAVLAVLAYIVIGPSLLAYACWGRAVAQAGPSVAAFFANLTPLFAALLSTALLGEAPRAYHALAFVLIAAGIKVASQRPAPAAGPPVTETPTPGSPNETARADQNVPG